MPDHMNPPRYWVVCAACFDHLERQIGIALDEWHGVECISDRCASCRVLVGLWHPHAARLATRIQRGGIIIDI
jgi:hypothetical protein